MGAGTSKGLRDRNAASSDNISALVTPRNGIQGGKDSGASREELLESLKTEKMKSELNSLQLTTVRKKASDLEKKKQELEASLATRDQCIADMEKTMKSLRSLLLATGKKAEEKELGRETMLDRPNYQGIIDEWQLSIFKGASIRDLWDRMAGGDSTGFTCANLKAELEKNPDSLLTEKEIQDFFHILDVNGNGFVTEAEFEEVIGRPLMCHGIMNCLGSLNLELKISERICPSETCENGQLKDIVTVFGSLTEEHVQDRLQGFQDQLMLEITTAIKAAQKQHQEIHLRKQQQAGSDKFSLVKAQFGNLKDFKEGMEAYLGLPDKEILKTMRFEHRDEKEFHTPNYGLSTTLRQEFDFVFNPDPGLTYPGEGPDGRRRGDLQALLEHPDAIKAKLTYEEMGALVMYTGPCYVYYNEIMRKRPKKNPFRNTLLMLISGTMKLTETTSLWSQRVVFRGLRDMELPKQFYQKDEYGCRGGLEWGMMSTSLDREQACRYAAGSNGVLFEIDMGQVDRGANLAWMSQYPQEQEILFPPGSYIEVMSGPRVEVIDGSPLLIWTLRLSVNMKHLTREELENKRKTLFMASVRNIVDEVGREAEAVATKEQCVNSALLSGQLEEAKRSIVMECNEKVKMFASKKPAWYNNDLSYQSAVMDAAKLKRLAVGKFRTILQQSALGFRQWQRTTMDDSNRKDVLRLASDYLAACDAAATSEYWHKSMKLEQNSKPPIDDQGRVIVPDTIRERALVLSEREGFISGADLSTVDHAIDSDGNTALMIAVEEGHPGRAKQLIDAGCSLMVRNNDGRTALMQSAVHGSCICVEKLVLAGSDLELADCDGRTALMLSAEAGHAMCIDKLLARKPSLEARSTDELHLTALCLATKEGHIAVVKALVAAGADANAKATAGYTCVLLAAEQGHTEVVKFYAECGHDLEKHDEFRRSPLMHTAVHNNVECFKYLLGKGCDVNHQDKFGMSPIMFAAEYGNIEIMELLLANGANVNLKDNSDRDALAFAIKGKKEAAQKLLEKWIAEHPTSA